MRLHQITLPARDPRAAADAYAELLGVPGRSDGATAEVAIGWTRLRFVHDGDLASSHHLAITIPDSVFDSAAVWLRKRTELLADPAGIDEFEAAPSWNARSVYFAGPEGSVLELIARRDRDDAADGPFGPHHLRCISEIGVAVEHPVTEAVAELSSAGVVGYGNAPGPDFGAIGDVDGLLILAASGRPWFPTRDRRAGVERVRIVATGGVPGRYPLSSGATLEIERSE